MTDDEPESRYTDSGFFILINKCDCPMKFFDFDIKNAVIIDAYSMKDRGAAPTSNDLKRALEKYLPGNVTVVNVSTKQEILDCLEDIVNSNQVEGMLICLNGHGSADGRFGNHSGLVINWSEIGDVLQRINANCSNRLAINTMCVCNGFSITKLWLQYPRFARIVIGMKVGEKATQQSASQIEMLLSHGKLLGGKVENAVSALNSNLAVLAPRGNCAFKEYDSAEYDDKVYLVVYHSSHDQMLIDRLPNSANVDLTWPYDYGDDPNFYYTAQNKSQGKAFSWGICRRDVRNEINVGNIIVFIARTDDRNFFLTAVGTVNEKLNHCEIATNPDYDYYAASTNRLVSLSNGEYIHDEFLPERPHGDWLRRMVKISQEYFDTFGFSDYQNDGKFRKDNQNVADALANNYVIFTTDNRTVILERPIKLAHQTDDNSKEIWTIDDPKAEAIANYLKGEMSRDYLYVEGKPFPLCPAPRARVKSVDKWRAGLIKLIEDANKS